MSPARLTSYDRFRAKPHSLGSGYQDIQRADIWMDTPRNFAVHPGRLDLDKAIQMVDIVEASRRDRYVARMRYTMQCTSGLKRLHNSCVVIELNP
ncbi:protein of unknown function [Candidatus Methylomirabilis oxygeniifera]|uniref:Uncharacterized protein n=1 Tax=Methylomirabilis oxygeniifera TaxID=671143 RepID=D5MI32_METO1|nr:protein of unknown function [Candidatus Methylomirabilis oxyfera]